MEERTADIAGLVRTIVEPLIAHPDELEVTQTVDADNKAKAVVALAEAFRL
jgi:predicted RNA-binding protein YlqC (UPF0109 family)